MSMEATDAVGGEGTPPVSNVPAARKHARPGTAPKISLYQPGRLRIENLQALLSVSHTTIYRRIKQKLIPPPDGWDMPDQPKGRQGRPYWHTATIRPYLEPKAP